MSDETLPPGWAMTQLGDICTIHDSRRIPINASERNERIAGKTDAELYPYYGATGEVGKIDGFLFDGEYVLIGEDGAPFLEPHRGVSYLVNGKFWVNNHAHILEHPTSNRFLCHYLRQIDYRPYVTGTTRLKLNQAQMRKIPFPLPPLPEQKRIVAKIEELFSELEAGEASLRKARRQLGVYRQSLLKQAFEGKLTAQWRTQNPALVSAPAVPAVVIDKELGELDALPQGWVWTQLANVGELGRGKSKHRPRNDPKLFGGPYPFIQTGEVKAATKTVTSYTETYSEFGLAQSKLWPKGTLCITIAANIAETAFLGFDCCFPDSVVGFVPVTDLVNAEFVELFIRAARSRIEKYAPATAQKNINLTTLESLVIPLCALPEQQEIVRLLDEQFEVIERNERELDAALQRSEALRQAILKKTFTGRLVPQDPSDEPASALLARLCAARETPTTRPLPV